MENQQGVGQFLLMQLAISFLIAVGFAISNGMDAALSALMGGVVCVLPNAFFVRKLFKHSGARAARQIVNGFYKGEAYKLILSVSMFALVFKYLNIQALVFFVAYIAAQSMFWFAPLIVVNKRK